MVSTEIIRYFTDNYFCLIVSFFLVEMDLPLFDPGEGDGMAVREIIEPRQRARPVMD
jgi:hypothetical protein